MNDQPKRPVETPREWLRYAEGDLIVAEREMQSQMPVYHTICFLCQSAAEKFLKGYLISQGWTLEKTHDIVELLELCADYDAELGTMIAEGAVLNEYIVAGRYPVAPQTTVEVMMHSPRPLGGVVGGDNSTIQGPSSDDQ